MKKQLFFGTFLIFVISCHQYQAPIDRHPLFVSVAKEKWERFNVHRCKDSCMH